MKDSQAGTAALYDLITKARGTRNIRDFAAEVGLPATTITRIKGGVLPRLSTIEKIAYKAGNGVTYEELMAAWNEAKIQQGCKDTSTSVEEVLEIQQILTRRLMDNGYSVREQKGKELVPSEFEIITDAIKFDDESAWRFKVAGDAKEAASAVLQTCASYYLGKKPHDRWSVVVADNDAFEKLKASFENVKIRDQISIINAISHSEINEYTIPNLGDETISTPFSTLAPVRMTDEDTDEFDIEGLLKLI